MTPFRARLRDVVAWAGVLASFGFLWAIVLGVVN